MSEQETSSERPSFAPPAAARLAALLRPDGGARRLVRVTVEPGGCSGLRYGITIDDRPRPGDIVVESFDLEIGFDAASAPYLAGAVIDYSTTGFSVRNRNAAGACACGGSFVPRAGGVRS